MHGRSRVYFYRNGQELTNHPANGMEYRGTDAHTGKIGRYTCHAAIFACEPTGNGPTYHLCEEDFGGPVMVKVWNPEAPNEMMALASHESVAKVGGKVLHAAGYCDRDGRGKPYAGHWPFSEYVAKLAKDEKAETVEV